MKNVICINHTPQECGPDSLIFVDTFDGQIIKEVTVDHFLDWEAYHPNAIEGSTDIVFYRTLQQDNKREFKIGNTVYYSGNEFRPGYETEDLKHPVYLEGNYIIKNVEAVGIYHIKHGIWGKPMDLDICRITMRAYQETDYNVYHPDEDRFYKELADQGIDLPVMSEEEWLITKIEDVINWIAGQLGYKVLNIINC